MSGSSDSIMPAPDYQIPEKPGGLLEYLGQWHWFVGLPKENRDEVIAIMCSEGAITPDDILLRDVKSLQPQFASYCWKTANRLMRHGYDEAAAGLLIKGLTVVMGKIDKEMLHVMYANYFYRQRKTLKNACDACVNHCEKAIRSYMQDRQERAKPVAPFKLLITVHQERGEFERIMEVCEKAIALYGGSSDRSKVTGFLRIRDLLKRHSSGLKESGSGGEGGGIRKPGGGR